MKNDGKDAATFIGGSPRSGTTLVHALLDGHPDLLVFPEEYLYLRPRQLPGDQGTSVPRAVFKDKIVLRLQGEKNFLDDLHEENRAYAFDYQLFEESVDQYFRQAAMQGMSEDAMKVLVLNAVMHGFARSIGRSRYSRWVLKHPHYELHWQQLFSDFPGARILYLIRDPRDVILSRTIKQSKKRFLKQGGTVADWKSKAIDPIPSARFLEEWELSVKTYHQIRSTFPEGIMEVRYEDLVSSPQEVMHAVAEFLGISWNPCLCVPTFLGAPWNGSSMQNITFSGVRRSGGEKKYAFSSRQRWQIDAWLSEVMAAPPGNYAPYPLLKAMDIGALLSRLPGESPRAFLGHRLRMVSNWLAARRRL